MKKAIAAIVLCVVLTLCMSFSAFAESTKFDLGPKVYLSSADINMKSRPSYPDFDSWIPCNGDDMLFAYNPNMPFGDSGAYYMNCRFGKKLDTAYPNSQYLRMGFELEFTAYANQITVEEGHYMVITLAGDDVTYIGSFLGDEELYFAGWLYDSNGRVYTYRTDPVINSTNDRWQASLLFRVGDDGPCSITKFILRSNMPSSISGSMYYDVNIAMLATVNETEAQRLHNEMMGAIDGAADGIKENQDKNADRIIANENANHEDLKNGWDSPEGDPSGDVDDMTGNMGAAEDAALGGKSDEEIQGEIGNIFSSNNLPGVGTSGAVSNFLDDLLVSFGSDYQALMILSLVLGLAAFLVGRSYRARGD